MLPASPLQRGGATLLILDSLPHRVQEIENVWIPMPDGCRLAARVWLPDGAPTAPVPAILESIPYRKRDGTRVRDETMHGWFAGHGYAAVRVDIRGSGDSEGVLLDEYLQQEQDDAVETIRWIASQPWCDGNVGMIGKSWGGIAALQVAARRPPALRAIITVCSTDDRFATDAHWMGGCLLNENLAWGSMLMALVAQPPDPAIVGERWRDMWRQRLEAVRPFPEIWMRHPQRDAYWDHGSVRVDPTRITCPVFAVGGWQDAYTDTVPRLLARLSVPRRGLVGPWAHVYPHEGGPGDAIGFLQEAKRWWDRWLRGVDTGIASEPMYRVWMSESPAAEGARPEGRWVAEEAWPSPRIVTRSFVLQRDALGVTRLEEANGAPAAGIDPILVHQSSQTVGAASGPWCSFGEEPDPFPDQQPDDSRSLCFDSEPLAARLEILGAPVAHLQLAALPSEAQIAVRLCDVSPDGRSTRIAYAVAKLDRRAADHAGAPGPRFDIALRHTAHAFTPGHRIRLAVSTCYWPIAWPSPENVPIGVRLGTSALDLPERPRREADAALPAFEPATGARAGACDDLDPSHFTEETQEDARGVTVQRTWLDVDRDGRPARARFQEIDLEVGHGITEEFAIDALDPASAQARIEHRTLRRRAHWEVRVAVDARLRTAGDAWVFEADLEARENERVVFTRHWEQRVPRRAAAPEAGGEPSSGPGPDAPSS